ncbi:MAG TPA: hypothetical protein VEU54_01650 [Steroidobacteraceae bacterium]|nr:hypothetical protein [Steroidobacteraceae bacterium]
MACAAETNAQHRLNCYDRSVAARVRAQRASAAATAPATPAAPATPTTPVTPAAAATAATPAKAASDFGVRNGPLAVRQAAGEPEEITAAVSGIEHRASGQLVIVLDNGQTWMQNEPSGYLRLAVGDMVRIRSAALGSYMLYASATRFTHVTRIR